MAGVQKSEGKAPQVFTLTVHKRLGKEDSWCIQEYTLDGSNALYIVEGISAGVAVVECDGSYKKGKGATSRVIEGVDEKGRITRVTAVPGNIDDHSSYTSGLVGILATLRICGFHELHAGSMTIGCDNESALETAFNADSDNT